MRPDLSRLTAARGRAQARRRHSQRLCLRRQAQRTQSCTIDGWDWAPRANPYLLSQTLDYDGARPASAARSDRRASRLPLHIADHRLGDGTNQGTIRWRQASHKEEKNPHGLHRQHLPQPHGSWRARENGGRRGADRPHRSGLRGHARLPRGRGA